MSAMAEMDMLVEEAVKFIHDGSGINEAIDTLVLAWDLTDSEKRGLIYYMAQKGYRYTNKGA